MTQHIDAEMQKCIDDCLCLACAESCRGLDGMEACVEACERCAKSCQHLAA